MQRVTHCLLIQDDEVFLLNKPRRNWWVAPGGKMEPGEHIGEAVRREYFEETALALQAPGLKAVSTIVVKEGELVIDEWMLFSFVAHDAIGVALSENPEGTLDWKKIEELDRLPMAEGDRYILDHLVNGEGILYGTYYYTADYDLLDYRLMLEA
ncbi:MAG: NUDIX hydrolase [Bacilli bacterium]